MKDGHFHQGNAEEKAKAYSLAVEFNRRFCERNKSVVCKELLGYDLSVPEQMEMIKAKQLIDTICPKLISDATEIIQEMLDFIKED